MIYLFVHDDLLTSLRFTARTEQLTKYCEPLQKMRVRLGACKIDQSPLVFYIADRSKVILLLWSLLFYVWLSCFHLMYN